MKDNKSNKTTFIGPFLPLFRLVKPSCLAWVVITLISSVSSASTFEKLLSDQNQPPKLTDDQILANSQISYRAEGGFTGVESYGVIVSCVKGKISVMKSIYDPRLQKDNARMRQIGSLSKEDYLVLWENLDRQAIFKMKDSAPLTMDVYDEFTNHFYVKVGDYLHQFDVVGISLPEASRYFAIRKLIDDSVSMHSLWSTHTSLARHLKEPSLTQSFDRLLE